MRKRDPDYTPLERAVQAAWSARNKWMDVWKREDLTLADRLETDLMERSLARDMAAAIVEVGRALAAETKDRK